MCLVVESETEIKTAKKDIVCYKIVIKHTAIGGRYLPRIFTNHFTYIKDQTFRLGGSLTKKPRLFADNPFADDIAFDYYTKNVFSYQSVVREGFHSYCTIKRGAEIILDTYSYPLHPNHEYVMVKCIVPKGSEYIKDKTGLMCSNQIRIVKEYTKKEIERYAK